MAAAAKKTPLATAVVPAAGAQLPADLMEDMQQYAGMGVSTDASDRVVPFVSVLQDMSPQTKKRDPSYIDGAEPGMILLTNTKKLVAGDEGILFQPCFFHKVWVEWIPRANGGGFVGTHIVRPADAKLVKYHGDDGRERQGWRTPDGNDLIETRYHYGHLLNDRQEITGAAVISFSSTGHTASRQWMELMNQHKVRGVLAPSFFRSYRLTTTLKKNAQGEWFTWSVEDGEWINNRDVREAGHSLYEAIKSGSVRAADAQAEDRVEDDGV